VDQEGRGADAQGDRPPGRRLADAIVRAADEVLAGEHSDQFIVDPYQAGAGTSMNMNVNEVLANRANELLGGERGTYTPVHPNDHVNMAQSTNDTIPTNIRLACLSQLPDFTTAFEALRDALAAKGREFDHIVKAGRTHLQDACRSGSVRSSPRTRARSTADCGECTTQPTTSGSRYRGQRRWARASRWRKEYPALMNKHLRAITGLDLRIGDDRIQLMQSMGDACRIQCSAPRPRDRSEQDRQRSASDGHGTSHRHRRDQAARRATRFVDHAGQDQPVDPEMVNQVCFQVMGLDTTVAIAAEHGQLELNVMMPVIAFNVLLSMRILTNAGALVHRPLRRRDRRRTRRCAPSGSNGPPRWRRRSCRTSATPGRPS
jgi:hypothetical protein